MMKQVVKLTTKLLNPSFCLSEWAMAIPEGPAPIMITSMIDLSLKVGFDNGRVKAI